MSNDSGFREGTEGIEDASQCFVDEVVRRTLTATTADAGNEEAGTYAVNRLDEAQPHAPNFMDFGAWQVWLDTERAEGNPPHDADPNYMWAV